MKRFAHVVAVILLPFAVLFGLIALPFYKWWLRATGQEIGVSNAVALELVTEQLQAHPDGTYARDIIIATRLPIGQTYSTLSRLRARGQVKSEWEPRANDKGHPRQLFRWNA